MDEEVTRLGRFRRLTEWTFLVYVISLPITWPFGFRYGGIMIQAADLTFIPLLLFFCGAMVRREIVIRPLPSFAFFGIYLIAVLISAALSIDPARSFLKAVGICYLVLIAVIAATLCGNDRFVKQLLCAWIAATTLVLLGSLTGTAGFYLGYDSFTTNRFLFSFGSLPPGNYPRVRSLFENANMLCNYLNVSLMLALLAWAKGLLSLRITVAFSAAVILAAILSISPGLGGIALSLGLFFRYAPVALRIRKRWMPIVAAAVLAIAAIIATVITTDTLNTDEQITIGGITVEKSVRVLIWENVIERAAENPIFGRGVGTDAAAVHYTTLAGYKQFLRDAHNAWLNVLGESGLVGLAAFTALCLHLFFVCKFKSNDPYRLGLSSAFVGAFLYQNLSGSFEDARHLWVLIGMLVTSARNDASQ